MKLSYLKYINKLKEMGKPENRFVSEAWSFARNIVNPRSKFETIMKDNNNN